MKKIKLLSLLIATSTVLLSGCKKNNTDPKTKCIDFNGYTHTEVIEWSFENNMVGMINYEYESSSSEYGSVIGQSLMEGYEINSPFTITLSDGNLVKGGENKVIPNVVGKNYEDAKNELIALGFAVDTKYQSSSTPKDTVIFSDPLPGVSAAEGRTVMLTLSSGEKENSVKIEIKIDKKFTEDITMKVYINGELNRALTKTFDPSVTRVYVTIKGREGSKNVKIKFNDDLIKMYTVDFDNQSYYER